MFDSICSIFTTVSDFLVETGRRIKRAVSALFESSNKVPKKPDKPKDVITSDFVRLEEASFKHMSHRQAFRNVYDSINVVNKIKQFKLQLKDGLLYVNKVDFHSQRDDQTQDFVEWVDSLYTEQGVT